MTKGELRKARKEAKANGQPLVGMLALPGRSLPAQMKVPVRRFREDPLYRWARRYYDRNGAPEGIEDR